MRPGLPGAVLIVLALWIQALAPALALRVAQADRGALPGQILCGHAPDLAGDLAVGPGAPATGSCALCGLCRVGAVPPLLPASPGLARRLRWAAATWPIPPPVRTASAPAVIGQPRGPPRSA
ncbi:DUF2946 domain-containing protein [Methylobacterium sp. NMS14P]|uniref:DUF2946 family protein n=1 Tax=Methylobacterium sp. NMS14P TaxID=2894310 RepID=UPI0023587686|nr:DUF2946 family protein [Methylobacterium sp. NMS14P]WCS25217.1 DUF2946 domain-containing protein [Methylobacterium sp. NMS14P]